MQDKQTSPSSTKQSGSEEKSGVSLPLQLRLDKLRRDRARTKVSQSSSTRDAGAKSLGEAPAAALRRELSECLVEEEIVDDDSFDLLRYWKEKALPKQTRRLKFSNQPSIPFWPCSADCTMAWVAPAAKRKETSQASPKL